MNRNSWTARMRPCPHRGPGRSGGDAGDAGDATLELVILAPVVLILIGLLIAGGRASVAQGAVDAAARDAARQASIARTPSEAQATATASARFELRQGSLDCTPVVHVTAAAAFAVPVGQPSQIVARVSCTVPLSGLLVPGLPGSKTLTASFTSPLDPYRAR
jgi:Flp pilus assembly protein TadG